MLVDSTLRRDLARSFGATLVVILTIVLTMMLIRTLGQAASGLVSPQDVVLLLGYTALGQLPTMLTLSLFFATVATLGRMYRDSEMAIWFASGIGLRRFVKPVLQTGAPVLVVVVLLAFVVWPWGNKSSAELRARYEQRSDLSRVAPGQFQTSSDGRRVFFVERSGDDAVSRRGVFILAANGNTETVTTAHRGWVETSGKDRFLVLQQGQRNEENHATGETSLAQFETYHVLVGEQAIRSLQERPPRAKTTSELLSQPTAPNQGELVWRFGFVAAAVNLLLLGIGLSATNPRRASNWNLLIALLGFVAYFNLINLSQAWVTSGRLGLGDAMLLFHGGAFMLAMALLWWREHSTTMTWRSLLGLPT
jgi:lipopolysaccharide export system permease protein